MRMMTNEPTILSEFPNHIGRPPIYPWDEWTDGQIRQLVQGVHFHSQANSFRTVVHRTARNRGLTARTSISKDGTVVTISFQKGKRKKGAR